MAPDSVPIIDGPAFAHVDASGAPDDFARWMAHQRRGGADRALDLLGLDAGSRVLDVGCGPGTDLAAFANVAGHAVGIDRSRTMARAAREQVAAGSASIVTAVADAIPFAADCFDACWVRAVLVHTENPGRVTDEIARVVRPGGRAVFSEPEHGSHVVTTSELDVFDRVKAHRAYSFASPMVGRRLPELAVASGMKIDQAWVTPIWHRSLASARDAGGPFDRSVDAAVAAGVIDREEADRYRASLEERDADGTFLFVALAVSVAATVERRG